MSDGNFEALARHLRRLYRQNYDQAGQALVKAEYRRLFGEDRPRLELAQILSTAWTEARQLAGWSYDMNVQTWRRADGSPVADDTGAEWAHL